MPLYAWSLAESFIRATMGRAIAATLLTSFSHAVIVVCSCDCMPTSMAGNDIFVRMAAFFDHKTLTALILVLYRQLKFKPLGL